MTEGLNKRDTITDIETKKVDHSTTHKSVCIDCFGMFDFESLNDDQERGFMGKLSDKFFRYLRGISC